MLRLTRSTVKRPVFLLERDAYGVWMVVRVVTALVVETEARVPETRDVAVPAVDECRYRSEDRTAPRTGANGWPPEPACPPWRP